MTEMKFFVYGSLSEGLVHFDKIKNFISHSVRAKAQGSAYRLKVGYPVMLLEGNDQVSGQLVTLNASDLLFQLLDEFHGYNQQDESKSLYYRREISVQTETGAAESASAYVLNPAKLPKTASLISEGKWEESLKLQPPLTSLLTEKQRTYIQRLGQSTGREIIPIDLSLYRELMNLEMIVDKGRRIALSKTGHEVFRYLK